MRKFLRLSLVCLMAMVCGNTFAQTEFDFNNDYKTLFPDLKGVSSGSGVTAHDGDFTEATTSAPVNGITVTVSPKTSGSNANRIWNNSPRLRMYSGTLTIAAPQGTNIIQIDFDGKWEKTNTVNTGNLNETTWTGSANNVVITIKKSTQLNSLTVYLEGEEPVDISNTPETAYTVAEANNLITAGEGLSTKVYVKGVITKIDEVNTSNFGNATYYINDTQTEKGQLYIYRGYYLDGEKFTAEDQIKVGDAVIVYGQLINFNGTYEMKDNQIYSINGVTTGITDVTVDEFDENAPIYNLSGQRVDKSAKGILIQNGKKFIRR